MTSRSSGVRSTWFLALVATLPLVLTTLGVAQARADGAGGNDPVAAKKVVVKWKGTQKKPKYEKRTAIPGIGNLALVCRPDSTMIRLYPYDTSAETQMWLAKFQDTDGNEQADSIAVKTVRVYRYATAADDGTGGTGPSAHEGLNRGDHRIENRSAGGYAYGLISQRPGRNKAAGGIDVPPVTSFYLTWSWNGFAYAQPWRSCKISIKTRTFATSALSLNWHGNGDATGHTEGAASVAGIGELEGTCGTRGTAHGLAIRPAGGNNGSWAYVQEMSGEGAITDQVESYSQEYDPVEGAVDGIGLPINGMVRIHYRNTWLLVSSYVEINHDKRPDLNLCEVAAAPLP